VSVVNSHAVYRTIKSVRTVGRIQNREDQYCNDESTDEFVNEYVANALGRLFKESKWESRLGESK
jgi:hypothetical protein